LLLGDWTPAVRDGIDVLRVFPLVGALVLGLLGDVSGLGVLIACGVAAVLVRFVSLPRVYDLSFVLAMNLQGWAQASGAYDAISWFDSFAHGMIPLLSAPVLYIVLARLEVVPQPKDRTTRRHYVGIFVVTLALGMALGAAWEMVEWTSDHVAGTHLQKGNSDTVGDLLADTVGAAGGGALLVVWAREGWGTTRRLPAEMAERALAS
jgi:uncharacterized membrane protein YjdF